MRYGGEWQAGKREGRGTVTFPIGGRYEGPWLDDSPGGIGDGTITFAGGRTMNLADYTPPPPVEGEAEKFKLRDKNIR